MIELMTKDGRPVKLYRKRGDTWVTIEFISTRGRDVSWRVPDHAVAEFLEGLAVPNDDCTGAEAQLRGYCEAPVIQCAAEADPHLRARLFRECSGPDMPEDGAWSRLLAERASLRNMVASMQARIYGRPRD